jgi:uncharacterized membrane protein
MSGNREPVTYKGRFIGIVVLTVAQFLIGVIHIISGLWLLAAEIMSGSSATLVYDVYTLIFGVLVFVFAGFIWQGKRIGWMGTIASLIFVIIADSLTILDLPSIPGIPKGAAFVEIGYSLLVVLYLFQGHVRRKFLR